MPFNAVVVRVLIASPSDTAAARRVLRETLEDWNSVHAENDGVMVLPVMWERDATPEMGDRPQGIINRQLVDAADVLVGLFWTRLGTPTGESESGTVEEIERFIELGKPVLLYFSSEPVAPDSVDSEELSRLASFRESLKKRGLIDRFADPEELRRKATVALTKTIRRHFGERLQDDDLDAEVEDSRRAPRAEPLARVDREREVRGFSSRGSPQYRTRERLVIENRGTRAAENLSIDFELPEGAEGHLPHIVGADDEIGQMPAGAALDFPMASTMGSSPRWDVVFRWTEGDAQFEKRQTLR